MDIFIDFCFFRGKLLSTSVWVLQGQSFSWPSCFYRLVSEHPRRGSHVPCSHPDPEKEGRFLQELWDIIPQKEPIRFVRIREEVVNARLLFFFSQRWSRSPAVTAPRKPLISRRSLPLKKVWCIDAKKPLGYNLPHWLRNSDQDG